MNNSKRGRPYSYPDALMYFAGMLHRYLQLGYRQIKGLLLAIKEREAKLKVPDYSTINRRFNSLQISIKPKLNSEQELWLAVDATGISVTNRGEWLRKIHRNGRIAECKGFLKIHVAIDVKSKQIVSLEVTRESVADIKKLAKLLAGAVENTGTAISRVYGDTAYDSYETFEALEQAGIEPVICIRSNAARTPPPDTFRNRRRGIARARYKYAAEQLADRAAWKKDKHYCLQWHAECFFSVLKRCYGKHVMARSYKNMQQELLFKALLYNMLQ